MGADGKNDGAISQRKRDLRTRLRKLRRDLSPDDIMNQTATTAVVCRALIPKMRPAAIGSYLALPYELDMVALHLLAWSWGLTVYFPRVRGPGLLEWIAMREGDPVKSGAFGVSEPASPDPGVETLPEGTLLFVPGVGFSAEGYRLGQGLGYYDRFLQKFKGKSVGIGFGCQRDDDLPVEAHDQKLNGVILGGKLILDPTGLKKTGLG
jgi:5-formyltetrahydrofolate cyclo-ligase